MTPATLAAVQAARADKLPVALATRLRDGEQALLPSPEAGPLLADLAARAIRDDRSLTAAVDNGETWFVRPFNPPLRLAVVGAVHVAQALAPMAAGLGYAVAVVDPRGAFATAERFPGVELLTDWPDDAMAAFAPDSRTAIVTLTHDPKLDDPALDAALRSDAFYIGALGSRKTHASRLARLAALGHDATTVARIRGPVGLDIGAVTAPEIALSVMAEIVAARRGAALGHKAPAKPVTMGEKTPATV